MEKHAEFSGAFQRPNLTDYLLVLDRESIELSLYIHVGRLEVGIVCVRNGIVVHAELPGAGGDSALNLLAGLPHARISPQPWVELEPNLSTPWRELIDVDQGDQAVGRRQRLSQARAELRELDAELAAQSGLYELPRPEPTPATRHAEKIVAEIFDWAAMDAYLDGDVDAARVTIQRRVQLIPGSLIGAANLEHLRLRLLDDEIRAGVEEVGG